MPVEKLIELAFQIFDEVHSEVVVLTADSKENGLNVKDSHERFISKVPEDAYRKLSNYPSPGWMFCNIKKVISIL